MLIYAWNLILETQNKRYYVILMLVIRRCSLLLFPSVPILDRLRDGTEQQIDARDNTSHFSDPLTRCPRFFLPLSLCFSSSFLFPCVPSLPNGVVSIHRGNNGGNGCVYSGQYASYTHTQRFVATWKVNLSAVEHKLHFIRPATNRETRLIPWTRLLETISEPSRMKFSNFSASRIHGNLDAFLVITIWF